MSFATRNDFIFTQSKLEPCGVIGLGPRVQSHADSFFSLDRFLESMMSRLISLSEVHVQEAVSR